MLKEYFAEYKNKTIGFIGCGVSNMPILHLASSFGIKTVVRDKKALDSIDAQLQSLGAERIYGDNYLNDIKEDLLFLSPGVRDDLPQIKHAADNGTRVTTEMNEFFINCPCPIIGITGSDGKTTTTTITAKLLEKAGYTVHLGGNIGKNLFCELDGISKNDIAVVELSSFQLMKMHISPNVAVITNVAPNHLDWHTGMDEYVDAKKNICRFQSASGRLVLNADDTYADEFAAASKAQKCYISVTKTLKQGIYYHNGAIYRDQTQIMPRSDILLPGIHNIANYCQAIAAVGDLVTDEQIKEVAQTFNGVEHRCELVRLKNGVKYYNSSIDSSPSRTAACLNSFEGKVICICGGYDKKIPFEPLAEVCRRKAKKVILTGATAQKIKQAFDKAGFVDYITVKDMSDAVLTAHSLAKNGDTVVLSPACASFDAFKNFDERGKTFKTLVNNL